MNIPNTLTMVRILLIPFFMAALLIDFIPCNFLIALVIFIFASITDFFDGKIARNKNQITDFGKFADPLADKMLVMSAFVCFVQLNITNAVIVMIILAREFIVTSIRLVASSNGKIIAANIWGKAKTVSQIVAIIVVLILQQAKVLLVGLFASNIDHFIFAVGLISDIFIWTSVALTLVSGIIYILQNKEIYKSFK